MKEYPVIYAVEQEGYIMYETASETEDDAWDKFTQITGRDPLSVIAGGTSVEKFVMANGEMEVEWRKIAGYDNYEVSNYGYVRNALTGKILKGIIVDNERRLQVKLYVKGKNGKDRIHRIHRLVLEAFVGECPKGMECRHLDGNPFNNHISNLRWGTPKENCADRERHGRVPDFRGEKCSSAKLTDLQVIAIRDKRGRTPQRTLAKTFGVTQSCISHVMRRSSWRHL